MVSHSPLESGCLQLIPRSTGRGCATTARLAEKGIDLRDPKFSVTPDGRLMLVLGRSIMRDGSYVGRQTRIGSSPPPYRDWVWWDVPYALGGPNFIVLPDGRWLASSRNYLGEGKGSQTVLAWMTRDTIRPFLEFPSGGDNSYAGLVRRGDELWMSYYSSHEGKASIYLVRVRLNL